MSTVTATIPPKKRATLAELLERLEDDERLEIIDGEIVEKAGGTMRHAVPQFKLAAAFDPFSRKPGGTGGPGGWWLATELHVGYANGEVYCHDVCGFRRDRHPDRPTGWPVMSRPDWVCEIVSPNHEKRDLITKPTTLHTAQVPHYWVLDPQTKLLLVHRWSEDGYIVVLRASAGDTARAEPFETVEVSVSELLGDDA